MICDKQKDVIDVFALLYSKLSLKANQKYWKNHANSLYKIIDFKESLKSSLLIIEFLFCSFCQMAHVGSGAKSKIENGTDKIDKAALVDLSFWLQHTKYHLHEEIPSFRVFKLRYSCLLLK